MGEKKIGFLNIEEASEFLGGMPKQTIMEKVREKQIKAYKPGRQVLFEEKDLREFVKRFPR